jgi:hypothetical protein
MLRAATAAVICLLATGVSADQAGMLARAKALELDAPYIPPPGDPLEHHAAAS